MIDTRPDFTRKPLPRTRNILADFDFTSLTDAELRRDIDALIARRDKKRQSAGFRAYFGKAVTQAVNEAHYRALVYVGLAR
jgi:hypothetical protein